MAYNIQLSNGDSVVIPATTIDNDSFSIPLVGRNWSGYGDYIATAFLHVLENFSNNSEPGNPTPGQLWHDNSDDSLYVRDAANEVWLPLLMVIDGVLEICGDILPCVDLQYDIGSPSLRWNNVYGEYFHGTSQSAEYADLAERYEADKEYPAGTLVKIGGDKEVTATTTEADPDTFSVVSAAPGLMLNSKAGSTSTHPYVVLTGRVPVRVTGKVKKGQRLISSDTEGVAKGITNEDYKKNSERVIIGRSLEDKQDNDEGLVLAFVSALR